MNDIKILRLDLIKYGFFKYAFFLFLFQQVCAQSVLPIDLQNSAYSTPNRILGEYLEAVRPGYNGYTQISNAWFPSPEQLTLENSWGENRGYPTRQQLGFFFSSNYEKTGWYPGILYMYQREGWDTEDFLIVPREHRFSSIYSHHLAGLTLGRPDWNSMVGIGAWGTNAYHQEPTLRPLEHNLGMWASLEFLGLRGAGRFADNGMQGAQIGVEMQGRQLLGAPLGTFREFLPDLWLNYEKTNDQLRTWAWQNLWDQRVYIRALTDPRNSKEWSALILEAYPDHSHMAKFQLSWLYRENQQIWGWSAEIPFIRVSHSHALDMDRFFGQEDLWVVELYFNLNTANENHFFGRNAPRPAPMVMTDVETGKSRTQEQSK